MKIKCRSQGAERNLALRKQIVEELTQLIVVHRAEKFEQFSPSIHLRENRVHLNEVEDFFNCEIRPVHALSEEFSSCCPEKIGDVCTWSHGLTSSKGTQPERQGWLAAFQSASTESQAEPHHCQLDESRKCSARPGDGPGGSQIDVEEGDSEQDQQRHDQHAGQ